MPTDPSAWWRDAVGYEVYIRSFADGNDDGVGDLTGLTARLPYLAWLGIDVVWVTPFYPSPMADFGYDVADYTGVHPTFGTLADFDALIAEADRLGLKIVIDLVPNHSSTEHPWFQAALADPGGPYRDYYHWRDAAADGTLPNNWVSYFGGPAWTLDEASGQHYLHLFLPEQADLNWASPALAHEFDAVLRFWLDRGVAGFRIDVAQALAKDPELRDNPELRPVDHTASRWEQWDSFDHRHDILQPETLDIYRRWRAIVDEYDAVLIGETYVLDAEELADLLRGDGLHVGFWFKPMHIGWNAAEITDVLQAPFEHKVTEVGWVLASHDEARPPTRFGGGDVGRRRSLALTTLMMGLSGMPFLYQGEELGIADGVVPPESKADPIGGDDVASGRDGCRTPMPWSLVPGEAFSPSATPWLPSSHDRPEQTVAGQRGDPSSPLHRTRALLALRKRLHPSAPVEWLDGPEGIVGYRRDAHTFLLNAGDQTIHVDADPDVHVVYSSTGREIELGPGPTIALEPDEAAVLR